MILRRFSTADYPGLIHLWHTVFGDDESFISHFLTHIIKPAQGFLVEEDGITAAAAYIIDGITVSGREFPYIYAVSTLPEYRGRGFGEAVSLACAELIASEGGIASLHPAEENLYAWYRKMGFLPSFAVRETSIAVPDKDGVSLTPLSAAQYGAARRRILFPHIFADFSEALLQWQLSLCGSGGYFAFDGGVLCAWKSNTHLIVPELIATGNAIDAIAALAHLLDCSECTIRTPALDGYEGFGAKRDFIVSHSNHTPIGYWGFAFD
ncbi:MAG: GNAT family N-acetyltransferase [Oscillospiraceae bacterium]